MVLAVNQHYYANILWPSWHSIVVEGLCRIQEQREREHRICRGVRSVGSNDDDLYDPPRIRA